MNDMVKNLILWAVIVVVLMSVFNNFTKTTKPLAQLSYSQFVEDVRSGQIREVTMEADNRTIQTRLLKSNYKRQQKVRKKL